MTKKEQYILAGLPFIIAGLIFNPWLISWVFNLALPTTLFSGILALSIILIGIGWGLLFKKKDFLKWSIKKYKELAVILVNIVLVIIAINFLASLFLYKPQKMRKANNEYYDPVRLLTDSMPLLRKVYIDKTDQQIRQLVMQSKQQTDKRIKSGKGLPDSLIYIVGFEGIRLEETISFLEETIATDKAAKLINGSVWVFGGSTVFGQGVMENETITAHLNRMDTANTYLNFGALTCWQSCEVERMVQLLKRGYRPKKVIFIDGLNDILRLTDSGKELMGNQIILSGSAYTEGNTGNKTAGTFIFEEMPLMRLIRVLFSDETLQDKKTDQIATETRLDSVINQLSETYISNYYFLDTLTRAYGIDFDIYYQPVGILAEENPFWRKRQDFKSTALYATFRYTISGIRERLERHYMPHFHDIMDVHETCNDCYVDLIHYNSRLNGLIAKEILENKY